MRFIEGLPVPKGWFSLATRSRSRSHKRAYDLVKIENRSRIKQSHKLDGVGVGRIRTFPFIPIPFTTPSLMIKWKLGSRGEEPTNRKVRNRTLSLVQLFFLFCLRFRQCSFHLTVSNGDISRISVLLPTPWVWFSLDLIALRFWLRLRLRLRS